MDEQHHLLLTDNQYATHTDYWRSNTQHLSAPFNLQGVKTDLSEQVSYNAVSYQWSEKTAGLLNKLSRERALEWFIIVFSGCALALSRHNNCAEVTLASPLFQSSTDSPNPLFSNVVPLLATITPDDTIKALIIHANQQITQAYKYQNFPVSHISAAAAYNTHSNVCIHFDEIHANMDLNMADYDVRIQVTRAGLTWHYNTAHSHAAQIHSLQRSCDYLLSQFDEVSTPLQSLRSVNPADTQQILTDFNQTQRAYPKHASVVALFEQQVLQTPDATALVFQDTVLSYAELNRRANRLAHYLRTQHKIQRNQFIALLLPRSEWMLIAIWGVLKSGAAYLPIEPDAPLARQQLMLADTAAKWMLTDKQYGQNFPNSLDLPTWFRQAATQYSSANPVCINQGSDLIYVMFTSGSTGKPKGVLAEHRGVVRLVKNTDYSVVQSNDRIAQLSNYAFDGSTYDIFAAHLNGAALHLLEQHVLLSLPLLCEYMRTHAITITFITTALFNKIIDTDPEVIRQFNNIYFGGQDASLAHIRTALPYRKHPQALVHVYGPTENTTFSSYYIIPSIHAADMAIPIGRAIANSQLYILDANLQTMPFYAEGDLYVSGDGLARGYLKRPDLTAQVFIPHPFRQGERLYKTGDRAYWRDDGQVIFAGRQDEQVKIRGYRIELSEIEQHLLQHSEVQQAYVMARVRPDSNKEIIAYVVTRLDVMHLRTYLLKSLPEYMLPSYFVAMQSLPLNPNGKIDKQALPDPESAELALGEEYVAPRTTMEQHLVDTWQSVLNKTQIGIHDNYFALGGDSIKAIQIAARLHQLDLKLEVQDIFHYQTIAELVQQIDQVTHVSEQYAVVGDVPLTAIQNWFFKHHQHDLCHHFNQSVLLEASQRLQKEALYAAFSALFTQHDALRMAYQFNNGTVTQINRDIDDATFDFEEVTLHDSEHALGEHMDKVNASINIETGSLLKVVLYHLENTDRLLIVIHHLVIDGISWRVLNEDLETAYRQVLAGQTISLPLKTDSFQHWAQQLQHYSHSKALLAQRDYWQNIVQCSTKLQRDFDNDRPALEQHTETLQFAFSTEYTAQLLGDVHQSHRTEINDLLLTALAQTLYRWQGHTETLIALEGHGRENIIDNIDINRTIGWFTSMYPVRLNLAVQRDLTYQIKAIKETLRNIPLKGVGYGLLSYLSPMEQRITDTASCPISFNYLGQFTAATPSNQPELWQLSSNAAGQTCDVKLPRHYELEIVGVIESDILKFTITYSNQHYRHDTIQQVATLYQHTLQELISYCLQTEDFSLSPSDIDYEGLDIDELDDLLDGL